MNRFWRSTVASLLIALHAGTGFGRAYVVKPGDSLSHIIRTELGGPVFGKKGKLRQVLQWNPDIKNPDRIYPNQSIQLGPDEIEEAPAVAAVPEPAAEPVPQPSPEPVPQPSPEPAPEAHAAAEPVAEAESSPWGKARFGLDLDLLIGKTSIAVTSDDRDFTSTPHSRLNRGVQLRGYYLISPQSAIGLQVSVLHSEFAESRDARLSAAEKNLKHVSAFYHQILAERFHIEVGLGTEQVYFLSRVDQTRFELDPIFVDFLKLSLGYDLLATQNWRWNLSIFGKANRGADGPAADVEAGHSYGAKTSVAYRLEDDLYLNAGVQYERRAQDSTQATQRNNDWLGNLGVTFLF